MSASGLTLAALSACDVFTTKPAEKENTGDAGSHDAGFNEPPKLHEQVRAGALPPLKERLPDKPRVVEPLTRTGRYGGQIRRGELSMESGRNIPIFAPSSLVRWDLKNTPTIVPALAESWEVSKDGRTYRFSLRKGVKWSDGERFTSDDLLFYQDAVLANAKLSPVAPTWLSAGGEPAKIVKVDDQTVEFRFADANGLLLQNLAFPSQGLSIITPAHYLKQFHPDYTSSANLDRLVKKAGLHSWADLFLGKNDRWLNPDLPVLGAWKISQAPSGSNRAIMERNTYYWEVDSDGRQLPYVDQIVFSASDVQTMVLRAANGEIDLQYNYFSATDVPVLARSAKQNGYKIFHWAGETGTSLYTNQSHEDPVIRKLMQNIDFRAALSHAINRDEMNKVFYGGLGKVMQPVCMPEDPFHVPGSGQTFIEHDPAKANDLLDKVGLAKRDSDGFRLRPDGRPLRLTISTFAFADGGVSNPVDAYQLVAKYWEAVGVKAKVDNIDSSLWVERASANKLDIAGYTLTRYLWIVDPLWYVPVSSYTYWAPLFGRWYETAGAEGEKPPPQFAKMQDMWDRLAATTDDQERLSIGKAIQSLHDKNVWIIGTVTVPFKPLVVNSDLVNVRKTEEGLDNVGHEGATWLEQVSYRHPDEN